MIENKTILEIKDLTKSYKKGTDKALDSVSLTIQSGEIFGLIGPNGAGKTTLIGCMLGLLKADSGSIKVFGSPPSHLSVLKETGYMPERVAFEHWMTAKQFLEFHYGLSKQPSCNMKAAVTEALEKVELAKTVWDRRLKTYSRGMLQRLNLAQVLIGKPSLVLLDEPTLGLDPTGISIVREIIASMKENGTTAVINSHQLDEIERLCTRVAFIESGKIQSINDIEKSTNMYVLKTSWSTSKLNGSLASMVHDAASKSNSQIKDFDKNCGRFIVEDKVSASNLLRALLSNGIPVDEAIQEKTKLENLFMKNAGVLTDE